MGSFRIPTWANYNTLDYASRKELDERTLSFSSSIVCASLNYFLEQTVTSRVVNRDGTIKNSTLISGIHQGNWKEEEKILFVPIRLDSKVMPRPVPERHGK